MVLQSIHYVARRRPSISWFCNASNSEFWADIQLTVNVEVVTQKFERAVGFFAEVILDDARGCQGSNRLLLQRIIIEYPFGYVQAKCSTVEYVRAAKYKFMFYYDVPSKLLLGLGASCTADWKPCNVVNTGRSSTPHRL